MAAGGGKQVDVGNGKALVPVAAVWKVRVIDVSTCWWCLTTLLESVKRGGVYPHCAMQAMQL